VSLEPEGLAMEHTRFALKRGSQGGHSRCGNAYLRSPCSACRGSSALTLKFVLNASELDAARPAQV